METLVQNTARLYSDWQALWIDYGEERDFHLRSAEARRVFAGPPRSRASVYDAPGADDITFLVDFSVVRSAAARAGGRVRFYGGQGELARRSGVRLDGDAVKVMLRHRVLAWMLALSGVGPEQGWRRGGLTWQARGDGGGRVVDDLRRGIAEFLGKRRSAFKLMIVAPRKPPSPQAPKPSSPQAPKPSLIARMRAMLSECPVMFAVILPRNGRPRR
jgi:hypothetical protein